jgi:hypothetical protein
MAQKKFRKFKPKNNFKQKQAYKPKQKKKFMKKRQPFVETKKARSVVATSEVMNPLVLASQPNPQYRTWRHKQISPIDQFLFLDRGVGNDKMVGRDIYSKYLKQKIEIELPAGVIPDTTIPNGNQNRPFCRITQPIQIYVVWGWIKKPFGYRTSDWPNDNVAVTVQNVLDEIDEVTRNGASLLGRMETRGTLDSDFLTFKDKRKNMWTAEKRLLRPRDVPTSVTPPDSYLSQDSANSTPGGGQAQTPQNLISDFGDFRHNGYPNVLQTTIEWKTNRKMRYHSNTDDQVTGVFAMDSWLPYAYICVPKQFQGATNRASNATYRYPVDMTDPATHTFYDLVGEMKVSANACHWFTDS